jgi:hypothetical protein
MFLIALLWDLVSGLKVLTAQQREAAGEAGSGVAEKIEDILNYIEAINERLDAIEGRLNALTYITLGAIGIAFFVAFVS